MEIKAAIFDMDGTLIDSLFFWDDAWKRVGKKYLQNEDFYPSEEVFRKMQAMPLRDAMIYANSIYSFTADNDELSDFIYSELEDHYINRVTVKKGAIELLEHLQSTGMKLCLASATAMKYLKIALHAQGLDKFFPIVLSCADYGVGKDTPYIYEKALEALGVSADESYVFEDSHIALRSAGSIGIHTVGVYDRYNYCDSLKENAELFIGQDMSLSDIIEFI